MKKKLKMSLLVTFSSSSGDDSLLLSISSYSSKYDFLMVSSVAIISSTESVIVLLDPTYTR